MPANRFGIDLAEIYRESEALKGQKIRNVMSGVQLGEAKRVIAERPGKERAAKQRNAMLTDVRGRVAAGDADASEQLLMLDPKGGPDFLEAVSKMDERKRALVEKNVEELGKLSNYVLNGQSEEERAGRYARVLENVSPEIQKGMPPTYKAGFVQLSLAKAGLMDKILKNPSVVKLGTEDIMFQGGKEIARAPTAVKPTKGGEPSGLKSADESLMYKMSVELLGGIFDEQGNITNLDPQNRNKAQAIATEASNIFQKEGNITRAEAVKRAAKKAGLSVNLPGSDKNDPGSIRNYLLNE